MLVYKEEITLIRNIAISCNLNIRIGFKGDLLAYVTGKEKEYRRKVRDTHFQIYYENGKQYITEMGLCESLKNINYRLSAEEFDMYFKELVWLHGKDFFDFEVHNVETGTNFDRCGLFKFLISKFLISNDAKCADLFYLSKSDLVTVNILKDGNMVSTIFKKQDTGTQTYVYQDDLSFLFNLNHSVRFLMISPNYEIVNLKSAFGQITRLRSDVNTVHTFEKKR